MVLDNFINPVEESIQEFRVVLQPGRVEKESKWGAVLIEVTIEIVSKEVVELVTGPKVGTRVNHGAAGQIFVDSGILPSVQLVHDDLPDGEGASWAVLQVAVAAVRHPEIHRVGPEGRVLQRGGDRGVVQEGLLLHHGELVVAADTEVGSAQAHHRVVIDVCKLVNDEAGPRHFLCPVVHSSLGPESLIVVVGDGVGGDLMSQPVHILHGGVVGVLVRHKKCRLDVAAVWIPSLFVENLFVQINIVVVDSVIEGDGDHLGDPVAAIILRAEVARHLRPVLRAEAVRQFADRLVALGCAVRVRLDICGVILYKYLRKNTAYRRRSRPSRRCSP